MSIHAHGGLQITFVWPFTLTAQAMYSMSYYANLSPGIGMSD